MAALSFDNGMEKDTAAPERKTPLLPTHYQSFRVRKRIAAQLFILGSLMSHDGGGEGRRLGRRRLFEFGPMCLFELLLFDHLSSPWGGLADV